MLVQRWQQFPTSSLKGQVYKHRRLMGYFCGIALGVRSQESGFRSFTQRI